MYAAADFSFTAFAAFSRSFILNPFESPIFVAIDRNGFHPRPADVGRDRRTGRAPGDLHELRQIGYIVRVEVRCVFAAKLKPADQRQRVLLFLRPAHRRNQDLRGVRRLALTVFVIALHDIFGKYPIAANAKHDPAAHNDKKIRTLIGVSLLSSVR